MSWIKLDNKTPSHPKIGGLSDKAFRWWVNSICYSSEYLTDGALPRVFWRTVPNKIRAELIDAKLWQFTDPDLEVVGYLDHQQSRETVENERQRNRDRRRADRGTPDRRTAGTPVGTTAGDPGGTPGVNPRPDTDTDTDTDKNPPASRSAEGFEEWYSAYPKKVGKQAALKAWKRIKPGAELRARMLDTLRWQRTQPQWAKDNGAYIPYPATYLNAGQHEDQPFYTAPEPVRVSAVQSRHEQMLANIEAGVYRG